MKVYTSEERVVYRLIMNKKSSSYIDNKVYLERTSFFIYRRKFDYLPAYRLQEKLGRPLADEKLERFHSKYRRMKQLKKAKKQKAKS